jgi:hypothetical protein
MLVKLVKERRMKPDDPVVKKAFEKELKRLKKQRGSEYMNRVSVAVEDYLRAKKVHGDAPPGFSWAGSEEPPPARPRGKGRVRRRPSTVQEWYLDERRGLVDKWEGEGELAEAMRGYEAEDLAARTSPAKAGARRRPQGRKGSSIKGR